jgi:transcriptional regulator with XRE-family HTH domain
MPGFTTVGPEIRALREKRKLPLETLALLSGVNAHILRRYEAMDRLTVDEIGRLPSEAEIQRLARVLRTSVRVLVKKALKRRPSAEIVTSGGVMTLEEYTTNPSR